MIKELQVLKNKVYKASRAFNKKVTKIVKPGDTIIYLVGQKEIEALVKSVFDNGRLALYKKKVPGYGRASHLDYYVIDAERIERIIK